MIEVIVAAAATSEQLAGELDAFMGRRIDLTEVIVARAIERGEVDAGVDPSVAIESVVGPIWFRLLLTGEPVDDDDVRVVAELVTAGSMS